MKRLMSLPLVGDVLREYGDLGSACRAFGLDGIEGVWGGVEPEAVPEGLRIGYHLTFYPDWLDFWRGDWEALTGKFGSPKVWRDFYGGENGRETLLSAYRADLDRAVRWGAEYVVFHVSDVSLEEGYTYRWEHSHEEVIDASVEVANLLLDGVDWPFDFLMENQWWPGLTLTDPGLTRRLLDGVRYPRRGLMLDTGHLMNANLDLTTQGEGVAWIHRVLDGLGDLAGEIRGVHLHQSLSGAYLKGRGGRLPTGWAAEGDYLKKFGVSYAHVLRIDAHNAFDDVGIGSVVERISPKWLVHELSGDSRGEREGKLRVQTGALG